MGEHLVGDDHRDRDRDQRLAQVLALVPAQEDLLDDEADDADARRRDEQRDDPAPGRTASTAGEREAARRSSSPDLERDVAAEQVEGAVGHVDDAHEPEDQREAARDDEEEPGEREAVEERDREVPRVSIAGPKFVFSAKKRTQRIASPIKPNATTFAAICSGRSRLAAFTTPLPSPAA